MFLRISEKKNKTKYNFDSFALDSYCCVGYFHFFNLTMWEERDQYPCLNSQVLHVLKILATHWLKIADIKYSENSTYSPPTYSIHTSYTDSWQLYLQGRLSFFSLVTISAFNAFLHHWEKWYTLHPVSNKWKQRTDWKRGTNKNGIFLSPENLFLDLGHIRISVTLTIIYITQIVSWVTFKNTGVS